MDKSKRKFEDLIKEFCSITGANRDTGQALLEACDGNLELAVNMHMESGGGSAAVAAPAEDDNVRAPIPQTEEMLVEDIPTYGVGFRGRKRTKRSVFDGFRDFQAEARQQEEAIQAGASGPSTSKKTKTLQDLFRPPIDITYKGTFYNARDAGQTQGKWLMVNIQNVREFACQALNRDIWSNSAVKALIKDNFIFWQVYHDSEEGEKYCQFYKIADWPYVAVLDPQTGENLITWSKIEPLTFCDVVAEFLAHHPLEERLSPEAKRVRLSDSIVDATEDDQLQAAIKASLTDIPHEPVSPACEDSDSEVNSELETFTDTDGSAPPSPLKTKAHSNSCRSPKTKSQRSRSNTPEPRRSPRRNSGESSSGKTETNTSTRRKGKQCESPLVSDGAKDNKDRNKSPMKETSPQPCCTSSLRKSSPLRSKSSPQKIRSPQKSASIHNNVHPAVLQNMRKSLEEPEQTVTAGEQHEKQVDCETSDTSVNDSFQSVCDIRDYKNYLGKDTDEKTTLMLRFPNGERERLCIPFSSKLLAVVLFAGSKGFSNERYELVAHYPHRQLSSLDFDSTLTDIGLNTQETIFVQART